MVINYTCVFAAAALKKKTKVCNKADVAESWSLGGSECETRRSGDYWLNLTPVGRKLGWESYSLWNLPDLWIIWIKMLRLLSSSPVVRRQSLNKTETSLFLMAHQPRTLTNPQSSHFSPQLHKFASRRHIGKNSSHLEHIWNQTDYCLVILVCTLWSREFNHTDLFLFFIILKFSLWP